MDVSDQKELQKNNSQDKEINVDNNVEKDRSESDNMVEHEHISYERGSRDDILKALDKCCSSKDNRFTGVVRINIAGPSKTLFKLYVVDGAIKGVESSEEIFVHKGAEALKRLIDLLAIPSTVGTVELIRQNTKEVELRLEVNPDTKLSKPMRYEDILIFIPLERRIPVIEKEVVELIGDEIDIALPSATEASVEETEKIVDDKLADVGKRMSMLHTALLEEAEQVLVFEANNPDKVLETLRITSQSDHADEALLCKVWGESELGEITCNILFVNGVLLGVWCENMGLEVYGNEALKTLKSITSPLKAEIYKLPLDKISSLLKLSLTISNQSLQDSNESNKQ